MKFLYFAIHLTLAAFWLAVGALCGWPWIGTALWVGLMAFTLDGAIYSLVRAMAGR
jgi:hypothetical protein